MTEARKLDGSAIAAAIKEDVAREVAALAAQGIRPTLAAVLVGHVPLGDLCAQQGADLPRAWCKRSDHAARTVTTEEMLDLVAALNARDDIDGI